MDEREPRFLLVSAVLLLSLGVVWMELLALLLAFSVYRSGFLYTPQGDIVESVEKK